MSETKAIAPVRGPVDASVRPPGSKSHTIRALFLATLAEGVSRLHHPLDSDDTRFARAALGRLGVEIDDHADPWVVHGSGGRLQPSDMPLDAGASGLTGRALVAIAPLIAGATTVTGRDRLPERPMGGLLDALAGKGIGVSSTGGGLPATIHGTGVFPGGRITVSCRETTQFLTALLLAAPMADAPVTLIPDGLEGSRGYVEMTLEMMRAFGAAVDHDGTGYRIGPTGYTGTDVEIEPDASAAVYPMVAAAITGGRVTIEGLGSSSIQPDMEVARVLAAMGCDVDQQPDRTIIVSRSLPLRSVDADLSGCPDGSLAVAVACLFAGGASRLRGLGSLRFKESDRLEAIATEIRRVGAGATIEGESLVVTPGRLGPAQVDSHEDHRIAMSMALVGLVTEGIEVSRPSVVNKTWPGYWDVLEDFGK